MSRKIYTSGICKTLIKHSTLQSMDGASPLKTVARKKIGEKKKSHRINRTYMSSEGQKYKTNKQSLSIMRVNKPHN